MAKSALDILRAARVLIADPERWCQGMLAQDADGKQTMICRKAVRFCAHGAILFVSCSEKDEASERQAVRLLAREVPGQGIGDFNDGHSHAEVLAAFDRAIARAESEATP